MTERRRRPAAPRGGRASAGARKPAGGTPAKRRPPAPVPESSAPLPPGAFRLGAVEGATPGKWIDVWQERMPATPLELVPLTVAEQREALDAGTVDAALVRLPLDRDSLSVIPLYEEVPVVVCAKDSHLTAADELTASDLAGEVLVVPADDVLGIRIPGTVTPSFAAPETTADAIAVVAAGVGAAVVPMSLARLHARRDVASRPLVDGPLSPVALAWPAAHTTVLVETFVGIVRGRTARSSRS